MRALIEACKAMKTSRQYGQLDACFVDFRKAFDTIPRNKLWDPISFGTSCGSTCPALEHKAKCLMHLKAIMQNV